MRLRLSTRPLLAAQAAAALAFTCSATAAVSLPNPDFSTGTAGWGGTGSWQRLTANSDGMLSLQADDLEPYYNASGGSGPTHAEVSVTITGLTFNESYNLAFDFGSVSGYWETGSLDPLLTLNPGRLQPLLNNSPLGGELNAVSVRLLDPESDSPPIYGGLEGTLQRATITFTAIAESLTITWRAMESAPSGPSGPNAPDVPSALLLLDNISVTQVPQPSSAVLVLFALGLSVWRRKRLHSPVIPD